MKRLYGAIACALCLGIPAHLTAQPGTITTVAGNGLKGFSGDGGSATQAGLREPAGVAVDAKGNIYIADARDHRVRRVEALAGPGGAVTTPYGSPDFDGSGRVDLDDFFLFAEKFGQKG